MAPEFWPSTWKWAHEAGDARPVDVALLQLKVEEGKAAPHWNGSMWPLVQGDPRFFLKAHPTLVHRLSLKQQPCD